MKKKNQKKEHYIRNYIFNDGDEIPFDDRTVGSFL